MRRAPFFFIVHPRNLFENADGLEFAEDGSDAVGWVAELSAVGGVCEFAVFELVEHTEKGLFSRFVWLVHACEQVAAARHEQRDRGDFKLVRRGLV